MANTVAAFGMRPVRYRNGVAWTGAATAYYIPSTDGTALYIGDPVTYAGSTTHGNANYIEHIGGGFNVGSLATVTIATVGTGNRILGPVVGVYAIDQTSKIYREASTERIVMVADDYNLVFQIQAESSAALAPATSTNGLNAVLRAGTGSTTTGLSGWTMDAGVVTAPASSASYQLTILKVSNISNNDGTLASAIWDVVINLHNLAPGVAGIA